MAATGVPVDAKSVAGDDVVKEKTIMDQFFEDTEAPDAPAEDLLGVMKGFVQGYSKNLHDVQQVLVDTMNHSETWDPENDPIGLNTEPFDRDVLQLMLTGASPNENLNKTILAFAYLCSEMRYLQQVAEEKFYGPLTLFGVSDDTEEGATRSEGQLPQNPSQPNSGPEAQMGRLLPFLVDLSNFLTRVQAVARNCVNQLAHLYHERQKLYLSTFKEVKMETVFEHLGGLLRVLVTLDAIVADNVNITLCWNAYKRIIKYVRSEPERYGVEAQKLRTFEGLLIQLDRQVLSPNMLETCLNQDYSPPQYSAAAGQALVAGNRVLYDQFKTQLKLFYTRITTNLAEAIESYDRRKLVDLFALYTLFRRLFERTSKPDKSFFRTLWEVQRRVPIVPLVGRAVWFVADFLVNHANLQVSSLNPPPDQVVKARKLLLRQIDEQFNKKTEELYQALCQWMVRIESELIPAQATNISTVLTARAKLLLNGLLLANQVRNLLAPLLFLHLSCNKPFISGNIGSIAVCAEMLVAIAYTMHRRSRMLADNLPHLLGQTQFTLQRIFFPIKKRFESRPPHEQLNDQQNDILAATHIALSLLNGSPTRDRRVTIEIALSIAQIKNLVKQSHLDEARYQLWKLNQLSEWQYVLRQSCNCDYLYWLTDLLPAIFTQVWEKPDQINRLQYLFTALRDPARLCRQVAPVFGDPNFTLLATFKNDVNRYFNEAVIDPLCRAVETDLRLHIHSVVLSQANLRQASNKDLSRFLQLEPLRVFDRVVDVRQRVTHYLDTVFYNLTTVTLHDWKIYAEMKNLAYEKYGLKMTEVHLPGHSHYTEALDVLEIMRNIHIFVARYNYNMNTQIFVERALDQKHLNSINVQHIANSIRTHGTGIMNTTVNFTYQFLCRKFVLVSEFLYDDFIKSPLLKDVRYFKQEREALNNRFPYERAEKLAQHIRKLGVSEDGGTFLDQFRAQVTEIGNALGYVRMVRSGGMQHCSDAIKFVPDLENMPLFQDFLLVADSAADEKSIEVPPVAQKSIAVSPETVEAAKNLDQVLQNLNENFAEGVNYYSVLVKVFQGVFQGEKQAHLRQFFILIPALTLSFVEKMLAQKDTLKKKGGRGEASFTDDGFALGLAYILRLLDQDDLFDSLHWFESVNEHLERRVTETTAAMRKKGSGDEDVQHHQLSIKRFRSIQLEYELLFYSFSGARIFFRDARPKAEEEAKQADGEKAPVEAPPAVPAAPPVASMEDHKPGAGPVSADASAAAAVAFAE